MNDKQETVKVEAWRNTVQETLTQIEFSNIAEGPVAAELLLSIVQRVVYEWMSGGMAENNCYNLVLLAVRTASLQLKNEEIENG